MPEYKAGTSLGLSKIKFDAEDTSFLSSAYFLLSDFDGNFKLGKNSITINNPPSDLQIEAYDINNNILYYEKSINNDFIRKTQSIIVSFHVYPQNASGIGKIIFIGTFNKKIIRYSTNVNIDSTAINDSKVRFYNQPTMEVTPLLSFATQTNTSEPNPKSSSGQFYTVPVFPSSNFNVEDNQYNKNLINYQVISKDSQFSSSFSSFNLVMNICKIKNPNSSGDLNINQTSSIIIKNIINANTLQLDSPILYKNTANNKNIIAEVVSGSYNIIYSNYLYSASYFTTASYLKETIGTGTRFKKYCVAEITYRNLDTFSGTIVRHKVYRKSLNIASDYTLILDENFLNNEILKNSIIPIKSFQNLGNFYNQDFIDKFWYSSIGTTTLLYNSSSYIDSMNIKSSTSIVDGYISVKLNTGNEPRNAAYYPFNQTEYLNQSGSSYDTNFLKFNKNTSYVLSFNCNLIEKDIEANAILDFYLTGSYPNNNKEKDYNVNYGVHLANLTITDNTTFKNFYNTLQFKFTPLNDIYGTIVIVPRGFKSLIINNLSILYDRTPGYSPNSYTVRIPFNINQPKELYDIKAELYDNNSNLVYSNLRTIQTFDPNGESSPVTSQDGVFSSLTVTGDVRFTNLQNMGAGTYKFLCIDVSDGSVYIAP